MRKIISGMIKPDTLNFLSLLAENNNREWFQEHKSMHDSARENVLEFAAQIIESLSKIDPAISNELDPKDCVMRIYRDIRFSLDKTPYKTNFGIGISPKGKSFNGPGYYVHIHPSEPFAAGGCWMPDGPLLKSIRQEIDYNPEGFTQTINNPEFLKYYKRPDTEHSLKLLPKGYPADHPQIEFLKLKSFTCTHSLTTDLLKSPKAAEKIAAMLGALTPFMEFLRRAG